MVPSSALLPLNRTVEIQSGAASRQTNTPDSTSFEDQLRAMLAESLAKLGIDASQIQVNVQIQPRQSSDASGSQSQNSATGTRSSAASFATDASAGVDPWAPFHQKTTGLTHLVTPLLPDPSYGRAASPTSPAAAADLKSGDPLQLVRDQLSQMGIDANLVTMELWDDVINNLGGNYTNHLIRAQFPNGRIEDFSVEWTIHNPKVTAVEIQRLMGMSPLPVVT